MAEGTQTTGEDQVQINATGEGAQQTNTTSVGTQNTNATDESAQQTNTDDGSSVGLTPEQQTFMQEQIAAAVNVALAQYQTSFREQIDNARSEGERLAKMSAEERAAEEERIEHEKFNAERAKLDRERLVYETEKILEKKNLSPDFAEFLAVGNAEQTNANIEKFEKAWNADHQRRFDKQFAGTPPKSTGGAPDNGKNQNEIAKQLGIDAGKRAEQSKNILEKYLNH